MAPALPLHPLFRFAARLVAFEDQSGDFVIPEDLSTLNDEELAALHEEAVGHFDSLFGDGSGLSDTDLAALSVLTEGIETLLGEMDTRSSSATERTEAAEALAHRAHHEETTVVDEVEDNDPEPTDSVEDEDGDLPAPDPSQVAASGRRETRINLSSLSNRSSARNRPRSSESPKTMRDIIVASGEGGGFRSGQGLNWDEVGLMVDRQLSTFNASQYEAAARSGQHLHQQQGALVIRKPFSPDLVVNSADPEHVSEVLARAQKETRLPGGSLTAAGGWGAPSQIIYDLCELESRDGLFSLPEINVARGGISYTTGPDFTAIYNNADFGFTEANDIGGNFAVDGTGQGTNLAGVKPTYRVTMPTFTETRLQVDGLSITAGLLAQRGYPEVIARTIRGALIAHDHRLSAKIISAVVAGSTAVTMTPAQIGATAPLLDSIEKQVEHYRYTARLPRAATLEAVFPYWVHGVIRSDLSRRLAMNLIDVTDAQIDGWFRSRGVSPQYVYDWQPLTGLATAFLTWPATVSFLLYVAGTWVKGGSDIITLDTIYDSVLLAKNDYTALFTEEGWLVAKLCVDSRVVTVALSPSGAANIGQVIKADGTLGP